MVNIIKHDGLHIKIDTLDTEYIRNVKEYFTEYVENYIHMQKYKSGQWNGKVCLFNNNRTLPYGLLTEVVRFHKKNYANTTITISPDVLAMFKGASIELKYDLKYKPYDYQRDCIEAGIKYKSGIIVSATASGKSLMISYILQNLMDNNVIKKPIIIVPSTALVEQFYEDLIDYGINEDTIGRVYSTCKELTYDMPITISTWQTLQNKKTILANYDCVIVDECLSGDTKIKTPTGEKDISDIKIGDSIISYNIKTNTFENDIVENVYHNSNISASNDMYELVMDDNSVIKITGNHKVLTVDGYKRVDMLTKNDNILSFDINRYKDTQQEVKYYEKINNIGINTENEQYIKK